MTTIQDCLNIIMSVADAMEYDGNRVAARQLTTAVGDLHHLVGELNKKIPNPLAVPNEYEMCTAKSVGKIAAIKAIKERLGLGLLEAKQSIEYYCDYFWDGHRGQMFPNEKYKIDPR